MSVTREILRQLFDYNPETGHFIRLVRAGRALPGAVAGRTQKNFYRVVTINRRHYLAHRLAWLYMTGAWPANDIDHINGIRADNRWANLREATRSLNMRNSPRFKNNKSGYKGVTWRTDKGVWRATMRLNGKQLFLGHFTTPELAHLAYVEASKRHFGDFARAA